MKTIQTLIDRCTSINKILHETMCESVKIQLEKQLIIHIQYKALQIQQDVADLEITLIDEKFRKKI